MAERRKMKDERRKKKEERGKKKEERRNVTNKLSIVSGAFLS